MKGMGSACLSGRITLLSYERDILFDMDVMTGHEDDFGLGAVMLGAPVDECWSATFSLLAMMLLQGLSVDIALNV
jgi:hypothetical protein